MKIAITGGIGSGKSYVCRLLEQRGLRVYDCDAAAKRLMRTSEKLRGQLRELVGDNVYSADGRLQKRILAEFLLASEANKQAINNVVHPAVAQDYIESGMEWLESAILFESGFYRRVDFDWIVCVTAPRDLRIRRIVARDNIPCDKAANWIDAQMSQDEVRRKSDFCIVNDETGNLEAQVEDMLEACMRKLPLHNQMPKHQ